MGIKQTKVVYVTDRGDEYFVEDMENSHLANTIAHIEKKCEALENVIARGMGQEDMYALRGHIACLHGDQMILAHELASRESCKDIC